MIRRRNLSNFIKNRNKFPENEEIIININEILSCGRGMGIYKLQKEENNNNINNIEDKEYKVRVLGVLPNEIVKIKVIKYNQDKIIDGELIEVIESSTSSSKDRVEPKCKYFTKCSGCQFQHVNMEYQHNWKRNLVKQTLENVNINDVIVQPVLSSTKYYGYRSKITPTLYYFGRYKKNDNKSNQIEEQPRFKIGFINNITNKPIDILNCPIATDQVNIAYSDYRNELIKKDQNEGRLTKYNRFPLLLRQSDEPENYVEFYHHNIVYQKIGSYVFQFFANSFFQVNPSILPQFYQHIINQAIGNSCNYLIDAYCGCGVFSIILSPYFKSVVGVDICPQSIISARKNIELNLSIQEISQKKNITFYCENVKNFIISELSTLQKYPSNETVIVLDPSRNGCDSEFLNTILDLKPKKIIYIACDITTQARDSKIILNTKIYQIVNCQPVDMFPQTKHIENILTFVNIEEN